MSFLTALSFDTVLDDWIPPSLVTWRIFLGTGQETEVILIGHIQDCCSTPSLYRVPGAGDCQDDPLPQKATRGGEGERRGRMMCQAPPTPEGNQQSSSPRGWPGRPWTGVFAAAKARGTAILSLPERKHLNAIKPSSLKSSETTSHFYSHTAALPPNLH